MSWRSLVVVLLLVVIAHTSAFAVVLTGLKLGGTVWYDTNVDGAIASDEPRIAAVRVDLFKKGLTGTWVAKGYRMTAGTGTTLSPGQYLFVNLTSGEYKVTTRLVPPLEPTFDYDGIDTPNVALVTLVSTPILNVDFGYVLANVGDTVWADSNANGVQDNGEPGIPGVGLTLKDSNGNALATATTDANGIYSFAGLFAGSYTIDVDAATLPTDLQTQTYDLDGLSTANTATAAVGKGQTRLDFDFGYTKLGSLGDFVWLDANCDGVQDSGEAGIPNVTVRLLDASGAQLATTTTDGSGLYHFSGLTAGTYKVQVDASTLPSGLTQTYDLDGVSTANIATATLGWSECRDDVDFGYCPPDDDRPYQTQTQGGWGSVPSGNNPGAMLHANFNTIYPQGLVVGSRHWLRFDLAQEVTVFIPTGGTAGTLWYKSYDPPTGKTEAGVFAGQVLALRLNVDFSGAGVTRRGLGNLVITSGPFEGKSVYWLLDLCEEVLGGNSDGLQYSVSQLNEAATAVNENYVDGTTDKGYLAEPQ